jgi:hypothetical protein
MNESGLDVKGIYDKYKNFSFSAEGGEGEIIPSESDYPLISFMENNVVSEENIKEVYANLFVFSEWYSYVIEENIPTPYSIITKFYNKNVEKIFNNFAKDRKVFCRLDQCSTKNVISHDNFSNIVKELNESSRTSPYLKNKNCKIVFREFIEDIKERQEIRCFVRNKILRGVSLSDDVPEDISLFRRMVVKMVERIISATEYLDCCIDLSIKPYDYTSLLLIEINSPTCLLTCSQT